MNRLLTELIPGGAQRDLSALHAKALLAGVRPGNVADAAKLKRCGPA